MSLIISRFFQSYISLSRITTPLPLPGLAITMSFLVPSFFKIPCFLNVFWVGLYEDQYTFARFEIVAFNLSDFLPSFKSRDKEQLICSKVAKISVFNKCYGSIECFKPCFSISTCSSVNL